MWLFRSMSSRSEICRHRYRWYTMNLLALHTILQLVNLSAAVCPSCRKLHLGTARCRRSKPVCQAPVCVVPQCSPTERRHGIRIPLPILGIDRLIFWLHGLMSTSRIESLNHRGRAADALLPSAAVARIQASYCADAPPMCSATLHTE